MSREYDIILRNMQDNLSRSDVLRAAQAGLCELTRKDGSDLDCVGVGCHECPLSAEADISVFVRLLREFRGSTELKSGDFVRCVPTKNTRTLGIASKIGTVYIDAMRMLQVKIAGKRYAVRVDEVEKTP